MAPPAKESDGDMISLVNAIASCAEFRLDSEKFAQSDGIERSDNVMTKFKRILKYCRFAYEGKKPVRVEGEGLVESVAVKMPAKAAAPRNIKAKGRPVWKKRKLRGDFGGEEEGTVASGEVKNGETAGQIKNDDDD